MSIKMTKAVTLVTLNPPTADYHAARLQMHAIALQNHFTQAHIYGLCPKTLSAAYLDIFGHIFGVRICI